MKTPKKTSRRNLQREVERFVLSIVVLLGEEWKNGALFRSRVRHAQDCRVIDWTRDYRPGDLVMETSSLGLHPERIGRLLHIEDEGGQKFFYLVIPSGEVKSWTNASFMRIPDPAMWPKAYFAGTPDLWKEERETGPWVRPVEG